MSEAYLTNWSFGGETPDTRNHFHETALREARIASDHRLRRARRSRQVRLRHPASTRVRRAFGRRRLQLPRVKHRPAGATTVTDQTLELNEIQQTVRDRYAEAAIAAAGAKTKHEAAHGSEALAGCCGPMVATAETAVDGSVRSAATGTTADLAAPQADACCGDGCCSDVSGTYGLELYDAAEREGLPDAALLASLGCGNPTAVAELREGETVLDLGSGGGIDVLLSARRVGPTGRAIGVDMTDEMLSLARRNAAEAGASNVEFRKGTIEALPLDDASVDVVISNCVINLASDKSCRVRRDRARAQAGWPSGGERRRRRRPPDSDAACRAWVLRRLHRRGAVVPRDARRASPGGAHECRGRANAPAHRRHALRDHPGNEAELAELAGPARWPSPRSPPAAAAPPS